MFRSLEAKFEFIDFNPKHKTVYNNSWNVPETWFFLCKGCKKWLTAGENIIFFMVLAAYSDLLARLFFWFFRKDFKIIYLQVIQK